MNYLGIDPGKKGAVAILSDDGEVIETHRYPEDCDSAADMMREIHFSTPIRLAVLEQVGAMPKQGVTSMFNFGQNYGAWRATLRTLGIPYMLVRPQEWQKQVLDNGPGDVKARSVNMAKRLYPDIDFSVKTYADGQADALHMARYAMRAHKMEV